MAAYTIAEIETGILGALEPLRSTAGVRTIKTYQAELDSEDDIARTIRLMPALIVVYSGSAYESHGARKWEIMRFMVFCCDRNLRVETEVRQGGTGNVGVYALLNAVRDVLVGSRLSMELRPIEIIREDPVYLGPGIAVYGAEYETGQAHLYPST